MEAQQQVKSILSTDEIHAMFDKLAEELEEDRVAMVTGIASEEKVTFFERMIRGDDTGLAKSIRDQSTVAIITNLIGDYVNFLSELESAPSIVAFQFGHSIGNIWLEVDDDDDELIHQLILLEAKINSKYRKEFGYALSSMIVEKSDGIDIPSNYSKFPLKP